MKIDQIILEGIDKTGKDTLLKYIDAFCNHKYAIYQRGHISNIVYDKLYNRPYNYENEYKLNNRSLYVLLEANSEDLNIRFRITNEPKIDIEENKKIMKDVFLKMVQKDNVEYMILNTSELTPYQIAIEIINKLNKINEI